jgi:hypothetical protein
MRGLYCSLRANDKYKKDNKNTSAQIIAVHTSILLIDPHFFPYIKSETIHNKNAANIINSFLRKHIIVCTKPYAHSFQASH